MKIFFVGINGVSMQGIAYVLKKSGHQVLGWDDNGIKTEELIKENIIYQNKITPDMDYVIYTSTVKLDHPLMQEAKRLGIKTIPRAKFLIEHLMLNKEIIAVGGAHGKTTTTAMIAHLLDKKSYFLGGKFPNENFSSNHQLDTYSVVETDESDGSFTWWSAKYKILLNFNFEHMDFFKTEENIISAYKEFVYNEIEKTKVIINYDTKKFLNISDHNNIVTFGTNENANFRLARVEYHENSLSFTVNDVKYEIPLLGAHNALNFCSIVALFHDLKLPLDKIRSFPGVKKRVQKLASSNDKLHNLYLDYGHHPDEVRSVLNAFKAHKKICPIVIFEPHKYSRTKYTLDRWIETFKGYKVLIAPIHAATETNILITREELLQIFRKHNINASLFDEENFDIKDIQKHTICFSAGALSERMLSKFSYPKH
jgi:UDP-N-acetylmuramate--alanine ligase